MEHSQLVISPIARFVLELSTLNKNSELPQIERKALRSSGHFGVHFARYATLII
jgi:hypothetical protein